LLDVPVGTIGPSLWTWLDALGQAEDAMDEPVAAAAQRAREKARSKDERVGLFRTILPQQVEMFRAEQQAREAQERAEREAAEAAQAALARVRADLLAAGVSEEEYDRQVWVWRSHSMTDEQITEKLTRLLKVRQARAECERLLPEFEALAGSYDTTEDLAGQLNNIRRIKDPFARLADLQRQIEWYRSELAAREDRAPVAARVLDYITAHDGALKDEIAAALGVDRSDRDLFHVLYDLQHTGRVRTVHVGKPGYRYWLPDTSEAGQAAGHRR
jgi:hypothetical protein